MGLAIWSDEYASFALLGGAAVAGYAAVGGITDAWVPWDRPAPARRAVVHACMTAFVCLAAVLHHPALLDIAVGVPFSATVAALTLGLGVVVFVAPRQGPVRSLRLAHGAPAHRIWAFVLPTALLTLLIGFSGQIAPSSSAILATEGAAILLVTLHPRSRTLPAPATAETEAAEQRPTTRSHPALVIIQAIVSIALAIIAGWGLVQGAAGLALHDPAFRPGVAAVLALGPAIVLPMIPPIATLAERGRRDEAISAIVGFALINLCFVLPLTVAVWEWHQTSVPMDAATTQAVSVADIPFPILVWRLDTVLLSTVGLLLLPAAIGRWTLSRMEGLALVGVYMAYLFLTLMISRG